MNLYPAAHFFQVSFFLEPRAVACEQRVNVSRHIDRLRFRIGYIVTLQNVMKS